MKRKDSIKNRLILLFVLIVLVVTGLSKIILPKYIDHISSEIYFSTIEKKPSFFGQRYLTNDMYAVQRLFVDSSGRILTNREDILSLRFFSESLLSDLSALTQKQTELSQRYTLVVDDIKVYSVIEKFGTISRVSYMYDIYGSDFSSKLMWSILILMLFLAAAATLSIVVFSNRLINRIIALGGKVRLITEGIWDKPVITGKNDELGDLEKSFEHMRTKLFSQEKYKQEMFQSISHELKTPVMIINTYARGIKDGIFPEGDLDRSIDVILDEAADLEDKVSKILMINKLSYLKTISTDFSVVKMKPIVETLVNRLKNTCSVEYLLDLDDVSFKGDVEKWTMALENVILNSIRYARSTIEIKLKNGYLSVYNDGEPIEFDNPDEVFEAYKKGRRGGSGIGLEITRSAATLFGYSVSAKNIPDGVIFEFKEFHL